MDANKYKDLYISEAIEHLENIDNDLVQLEKSPDDENLMMDLLRHAHTLKGISASMGYNDISVLSHSLESMIENLKKKSAAGSISTLFGTVDELKRLVESSKSVDNLVNKQNSKNFMSPDTESLFTDLSVLQNPASVKKINDVRVRTEKLDKLMEITSELTLNKMLLSGLSLDVDSNINTLIEKNSRLISDLQYQVLQLRLTPVAQVFNRFPRMVRDLSTTLNKEVDLEIKGADIELDGEILDQIGEPLVHLIRNAIDHGIEKKGLLMLSAERIKDKVLIEVSDNGRGIDWKKLAEKSGRKDLSDPRDLLFQGVSTSEKITEISGRGIGMGVVKNTLERIGGHLTVISERNKGTKFIIELPVSIAIIKGLIIKVRDSRFVVPLNSIEKVFSMKNLGLSYQGEQAIVLINESEIPLIDLEVRLALTNQTDISESYKSNLLNKTMLLVNKENIYYGFLIDQVISQQEVVVKTLSSDIRELIPFSTATILEDGKPVPIIDFNNLI